MAEKDAATGIRIMLVDGGEMDLDQLRQLIREEFKGLVTVEALDERLKGVATVDALNQGIAALGTPAYPNDVKAMIDGAGFATMKQVEEKLYGWKPEEAAPAIAAAVPDKGPIDPKYLKGLIFRTSKPRKGKPGEDDATIHDPVERPLAPGDVLDWVDRGDVISFVAADGGAYKVKK